MVSIYSGLFCLGLTQDHIVAIVARFKKKVSQATCDETGCVKKAGDRKMSDL